MIIIIILIACVIAWAVIQKSLLDSGVPPRSRSSLRYQRRKARKLGVNAEDLEINSRSRIPDGTDEIRERVRVIGRWLWIPTGLIVAAILWPFIERLWK